jgi:hypothetical protein
MVFIDVVLDLWNPSREIQCQALSLDRVHPKLLGVTPSIMPRGDQRATTSQGGGKSNSNTSK